LKLDNILLTFESESTIESYADRQNANPMARKVFQDHVVYRCHNDFGPILISSIRGMIPKITDFGLAQRCEVPVLCHPIQTDIYRAPEVILGIGWKFSADMWNFGLMVCSRLPFSNHYIEILTNALVNIT
jgi:serine/threonine protein kinase